MKDGRQPAFWFRDGDGASAFPGLRALALVIFAAIVAPPVTGICQDRPEIFNDTFRDVLKQDPRHYKVEFENDEVRVLRANLGPDEGVPQHDDRDCVLVAISEVHLRFTRPDKQVQEVHVEAGQARWLYGDTHSAKNLSNRSAQFLVIEIKR